MSTTSAHPTGQPGEDMDTFSRTSTQPTVIRQTKMNELPNNAVLSLPKEAQMGKMPINNQQQLNINRPETHRPAGQQGQPLPPSQQIQGQPGRFILEPGLPQQQFRPGPSNNPPRFPLPGVTSPQAPPGQPQPLFRPQQRFVAVNPPGGVRFRPPGPPGQQLGSPLLQRQPRPIGLSQQQSFAGILPLSKSAELQRSNTLDSNATDVEPTQLIKHEAKEKPQYFAEPPKASKPPASEVMPPPQMKTLDHPPQSAAASSVPPNSLRLNNNSIESRNSSSSSPQPESVIEVKPTEAKLDRRHHEKPPMIPKLSTPLKNGVPPRTPSRNQKKEGDNDSGVDETTQGNDHSTNDDRSPRKSARNNGRLTTPTKYRSFSRGSRSPHLTSPDSQPGTPGPTEKKKIPMNKVQVGFAPSPNLKVVKSKIGSLSNASYKPGGGNVKIETRKVDVSQATSRIGAKNDAYSPSGGEKKIQSQKLQWTAKSKVGSLENAAHKPKGGEKKIESVKLDFKERAKSKVGSKDNMQHTPGGGDIKIIDRKINVQAESKIGSMDNVKHKPGGGEKKIFDDKDYLRQRSAGGMSEDSKSMYGSQNSLPSQHSDNREPVSDENLNREN